MDTRRGLKKTVNGQFNSFRKNYGGNTLCQAKRPCPYICACVCIYLFVYRARTILKSHKSTILPCIKSISKLLCPCTCVLVCAYNVLYK